MNFRNVNDEFYDGSTVSGAEDFWRLKNHTFRPSLRVTTASFFSIRYRVIGSLF